jgi:hypothetical protein
MLRSIVAIAVGFLLIGALAMGTDMIVMKAMPGAFDEAGRTSDLSILMLMAAYVAVYAITGCYVTARLAPDRPMLHALILGALGLAMNIVATISLWGTAPAWYHILNLLLVMPYAWIGGRLRERQLMQPGRTPAAAI